MTEPASAVLLDVGGVFLLPDRSHIRTALDQIKHSLPDDEAIDRAHYLAAAVFPMDMDGHEFLGPYWNEYLEVYARALDVPDDRVPEAVEHLRNAYVTGELWSRVIEGSKEGLSALVDTGIPVGVVSNSDGTIERRLREMEILQVGEGAGVEVRCVIDSGAVNIEKPDPRIFDFALEILELPPEGIWYVGDTPGFDVTGARRAGLRPILMDPFDVHRSIGVDCVHTLSDIAAMLTV